MSYVSTKNLQVTINDMSKVQIQKIVKDEFIKISSFTRNNPRTFEGATFYRKLDVENLISELIEYTSNQLTRNFKPSFSDVGNFALGRDKSSIHYPLDKLTESINAQIKDQLK